MRVMLKNERRRPTDHPKKNHTHPSICLFGTTNHNILRSFTFIRLTTINLDAVQIEKNKKKPEQSIGELIDR